MSDGKSSVFASKTVFTGLVADVFAAVVVVPALLDVFSLRDRNSSSFVGAAHASVALMFFTISLERISA